MNTRRLHGPAVKAIREALGIKHGVFAKDVGVSPGYLSNIERGNRQPSPAINLAMAKRLGVTLDEITYARESAETAA